VCVYAVIYICICATGVTYKALRVIVACITYEVLRVIVIGRVCV